MQGKHTVLLPAKKPTYGSIICRRARAGVRKGHDGRRDWFCECMLTPHEGTMHYCRCGRGWYDG